MEILSALNFGVSSQFLSLKGASYLFEFTSKELFEELVSSFMICSDNLYEFIVIGMCNAKDRVCTKPNMNGEDFIFVYGFFIKEYNVFFHLSLFEFLSVGC